MHSGLISSEQDMRARLHELIAGDEERQKEIEEARKNQGFTQVYPKGFDRIKSLIKQWPLAAQLYLFLAQHIEDHTGAVVANQELLAKELGVTTRTIRKVTKWLDENNIVIRVKLSGSHLYAYCLDPLEVWKSWNTAKEYAAFRTKTLARKSDNADIKRRLKTLLAGQQEIPVSEEVEVDGQGSK